MQSAITCPIRYQTTEPRYRALARRLIAAGQGSIGGATYVTRCPSDPHVAPSDRAGRVLLFIRARPAHGVSILVHAQTVYQDVLLDHLPANGCCSPDVVFDATRH